jgi:tetratricopeptide (TPR) repeat protein
MKPTRHVTAVLLLVAIAAVGCSNRGERTTQAKAASPNAEQPKPVATRGESLPLTPAVAAGVVSGATPKIPGPVTFADGQAAYQARKYSDATAMFERYTGQRPANAWGYYMLGLSAWKSGDRAKSEQAFEKALSIDPMHVKSLVNLSRVFLEEKRYDDALDRLTTAAEINPESTEVFRLLGRTYVAQGKSGEAMDAYRRAIEIDNLDAWSMNNFGLLLVETKRAEEALPLLAKAVELRQGVPAFHNNLGMALEQTGRFKAAVTAYKGALTADPGYDKAKRNLARVELVQGNAEEPVDVGSPANTVVEKTAKGGAGKTPNN